MNGASFDGGFLRSIPPNASQSEQVAAINEVINRLNDLLRVQTFSDNTTRRMLIGYQQDGWGTGKNFGIKISQEGIDVTTATDSELLFSMDLSAWNWFDPNDGSNPIRIGIMPDGSHDVIVAKPGESVNDYF